MSDKQMGNYYIVMQVCTNSRCQIIGGTKFCILLPNIFETLVWVFLHSLLSNPDFWDGAQVFRKFPHRCCNECLGRAFVVPEPNVLSLKQFKWWYLHILYSGTNMRWKNIDTLWLMLTFSHSAVWYTGWLNCSWDPHISLMNEPGYSPLHSSSV
jgi:hypothetical protein